MSSYHFSLSLSSSSSCVPQQVTFSQGPSFFFADDDDCNEQVILGGLGLCQIPSEITFHTVSPRQVGYSAEGNGLHPWSAEFASVKNLLLNTWDSDQVGEGIDATGLDHDSINIVNIYDVNSPHLLRRYENRKAEISCELSPYAAQSVRNVTGEEVATTNVADQSLRSQCNQNLNECFLFHGTSEECAKKIMLQGFKAGSGGLFASAIYFAESSTKADQYADSKGNRVPNGTHLHMLIAKVVLGTVKICQSPPCKYACTGSSPYHSVIGTHKQTRKGRRELLFREFVIKNESQCFPQYLVEYYRS